MNRKKGHSNYKRDQNHINNSYEAGNKASVPKNIRADMAKRLTGTLAENLQEYGYSELKKGFEKENDGSWDIQYEETKRFRNIRIYPKDIQSDEESVFVQIRDDGKINFRINPKNNKDYFYNNVGIDLDTAKGYMNRVNDILEGKSPNDVLGENGFKIIKHTITASDLDYYADFFAKKAKK